MEQSENYIVINGKKAELTEEQLKALGIEVEKKSNSPFNNEFIFGEKYYFTNIVDGVDSISFDDKLFDENFIAAANSFNDKDFANQVYLHELLNRKLLKYACENDAFANDWSDRNSVKFLISKNTRSNKIIVDFTYGLKHSNVVYFTDEKVAKQAIEDVILPFMVKHPEFLW